MKRTAVFVLSLLVIVSISGTGNNAFAGNNFTPPSPPPPEVVVLVCAGTNPSTGAFTVTYFSNSTKATNNLTIGVGDDCTTDLVELANAGLFVSNVQALGSSLAYTLVNGLLHIGPSLY